jgi:NAD(P)-dependent dehydrogenase (short-subunit alcohol dehydrogenase family)
MRPAKKPAKKKDAKVAIITGAAQGIGQRTAQVLAAQGYRLLLNDLRVPEETLSLVRGAGSEAAHVAGDVSREEVADEIAEKVISQFGTVSVLVNNAGISLIQRAEATSVAEWRKVLDVNLLGPFLLSKTIGELMLKQRQGAIINVASIAGLCGVAERAAYNASKHGLIGLTRTLAAEWGGYGVRSNAVCPGWVKTEMDDTAQAKGLYSDRDITNRVPMGRFASPDDVARAIAFLADPEQSGFVNGHALVVDGGWSVDAGWESLRLSHR